MSITSYAQNFEDVMLWRALGHIERGFYIDIGAQDPVIDSVSLAFHERSWQGIHVEPTPHYAELLRQNRAGDRVIQAAVGNGPAVLPFFEIPDTGISTGDPIIAEQHRQRGFNVHEITVPCITLSSIFDACAESEIRWLKIDVEGFERQVLLSWGTSAARPWVVIVEGTLPCTQIETHESWEAILTDYGYVPVYFDGLNRYYISAAHPELKEAFLAPPNVFDGFNLNGTANAPFHNLIVERHQKEINEVVTQLELQKQTTNNEIERLSVNLISVNDECVKRAEQASQARQEAETLLRNQVQREQEVSAQLLAMQRDCAENEKELRKEITILQLQTQQQDAELRTRLDEHHRTVKAHADLEVQLNKKILLAQKTNQQLRLMLVEAQRNLETIRTSFIWRMTTPLRALASFINLKKHTINSASSEQAVKQFPELPHPQILATEFTMPPSAQATTPITTVNELLVFQDQQFICHAFQTVLGRAPDAEGMNYYLGRIRAGYTKMSILMQLCLSNEGRAYAPNLRGLDSAIQRYQREKYPLIGWLFRKFYGAESNHPIERKLRAIEQQIFLIRDENSRHFKQIAAALTVAPDNASSITPDSPEFIHSPPLEPDGLKQLTPRAKNIYIQLKTAAAVNARRTA